METMAEYLAELVKAGLEDRKAASLPEGVSVREVVKISEENHMDYLLLGALLKTDGLSEEEKGLLREKVLGSMLFTGMQLQELKKLEERMEQAKIPCQPMKGARMKFYYPSPFLREMSDIDILIHGDFMEQAAVELEAMGYVLQQKIKHHDIYRKAPGIVVEAHRAMYDRTVDERQYAYFSDLSRAVRRKGFLYVYDFDSRRASWLELDGLREGYTPAFADWLDDRYILFVEQLASGAFTVGGDLCVYDTENDTFRRLTHTARENFQIRSFEIFGRDYLVFNCTQYDEAYIGMDSHPILVMAELYELIRDGKTVDLRERVTDS